MKKISIYAAMLLSFSVVHLYAGDRSRDTDNLWTGPFPKNIGAYRGLFEGFSPPTPLSQAEPATPHPVPSLIPSVEQTSSQKPEISMTVRLDNGMIVDRLVEGGQILRGNFSISKSFHLRADMTDEEFIAELRKIGTITSIERKE